MNKRDAAILDWVRKNRPDCIKNMETLMQTLRDRPNDDMTQATALVMCFAFEGGRQFQHDTGAELGNPSVYL